MNIRSIYKKYKRKKQLKAAAPYLNIHPDAILSDNFNLDLRAPKSGHTYLEIGAKSIVDSSFVFETETGHIKVGERVHIGGGSQLISKNNITIGNDVIIAWNCTIYDHNSLITIVDKVWMGFGVTILKGVTIGEGAVIGACSVVTRDVAPYTVVAGNPAQVVRTLF